MNNDAKTWKILALIFLLTTGILIFTYTTDKTALEKSKKEFPLINPRRFEIDQKDVVVNLQPLRGYLRELVREKGSNSISIYFEFFNTGANISINPDL